MSHVIRVKLGHESAPSDATDRVEEIKERFRPILSETHTDYRTRTDINDEPLYDEFLVRFDIRDSITEIVDNVVERFKNDVEWLIVETRQDDREWRKDAYAEDPAYYPPEWECGHRTPPSLNRGGLFTVDAGAADYLVNGTEYSAAATTFEPTGLNEEPRTDLIVAGESGEIVRLEDTDRRGCPPDVVCIGRIEVHPGKVVVISDDDVDVETTDWTTAHESGTIPDDM